jgi:branched-chain amino acid transport system permease protein
MPFAPPVFRKHDYVSITLFIGGVALLGPKLASSASSYFLLNLWLVYGVVAVGFYLVFGVAGKFAFCQTFMMTLGAFTAAFVAQHHPYWMAVVSALAVTAAVAAVFFILMRRTQEFYFAIASLALAQIGLIVFNQWTSFTGTGGARQNITYASIFGHQFVTNQDSFWLILGALALVLLLVTFIERSPLGREAIAARDMPVVSSTLGIPVARVQLALFIVGSCLASLGGVLYAFWQGFVSTSSFGLDLSIGIFLMVILGGLGSKWGALIGAAFYVYAPDQLQSISKYETIVYGCLLVLVIVVFPDGVVGAYRQILAKVRPRGRDTEPEPFSRRSSRDALLRRLVNRA